MQTKVCVRSARLKPKEHTGTMAIYHFSVKMLSRSDGRDAVAAAAYRAGEKLKNEKTGETHDYTKKRNVISSQVIIPTGVEKKLNREELWNKTELAEKRKNSCLAREFEVALPAELPLESQTKLAVDFAQELADKYKIVADVAIHKPDRRGDERNVHAHILTTTRRIDENGELGDKARELDDYKTRAAVVEKLRERWAEMVNAELERYGRSERIDHRTLAAQGIDRVPQIHVGVHATQMERRGILTERGETNRKRIAVNKYVDEFKAKLAAEQEKAAARAAAKEKAAGEKPTSAAQKSELDQQRRPDERPQPAETATQAQTQPQPTAEHPASPTQKPAEGAKKAETAKTTPQPQEGAKKAVVEADKPKEYYTQDEIKAAEQTIINARKEYNEWMKEQLLKDAEKAKALQIEAGKRQKELKEQEPKRKTLFGVVIESQEAYDARLAKWEEEHKAERETIQELWNRAYVLDSGPQQNKYNDAREKVIRDKNPEAARILNWAENQKKLEQDRRLRERLKERQEQKSRGFDITD